MLIPFLKKKKKTTKFCTVVYINVNLYNLKFKKIYKYMLKYYLKIN